MCCSFLYIRVWIWGLRAGMISSRVNASDCWMMFSRLGSRACLKVELGLSLMASSNGNEAGLCWSF